MNISPISQISNFQIQKKLNKNQSKKDDTAGSVGYVSIPSYEYISFQARVDKGMKRFYEANSHRMPKTLKTFIDSLPDKELLTPLNANKAAFAGLLGISSVAMLKEAFPDEELVQDVKDVDELNSRRGILSTYRQYKDLFNKDALVNNENLSIWLVKKVLLDSKTIDEINEDFKKEANQDFLNFYYESEPEGQPIRHSTLSALGIKMPEKEYMASLRYTREGYSDEVGDLIKLAHQIIWEGLSDDEKLRRATKLVLATTQWWDNIPHETKLDILAGQNAELEFYKLYKQDENKRAEKKESSHKAQKTGHKTVSSPRKEHINTGIKVEDELLKLWLRNNIALAREKMSEADRREIAVKQQQTRAQRWEEMSTAEKVEYISRLQAGSEKLRFAMFDAWNNNPEILIKLSIYLKKQSFEKPSDILYGTKEYNTRQSEVMKNFWELNPEFATKLGTSIKEAHEKVNLAKKEDRFEELKLEILNARDKRKSEIELYVKNYKEILSDEEYNSYPQYMKDFIDAYNEASMEYNKHLPVLYLKDFFKTVHNHLEENVTNSWAKALRNEILTKEDENNLEIIKKFEPYEAKLMNRAIEASIADILYDCTQDPRVYLMSQSDCKAGLNQVDKGYDEIILESEKTGRAFIIPIKNRKIDDKRIEDLYRYYKSPVQNIHDIIANFFRAKGEFSNPIIYDALESYLQSYGRSINHIFSFDSKLPIEAKAKFLEKFLNNMPSELYHYFSCKLKDKADLEKEEKINVINNKIIRKYNFIPQELLGAYLYELNNSLRSGSIRELENFEAVACKPRKTAQERGKIATIQRSGMRDKGNLFTFLAIEQALGDVLYKATNDSRVYSLCFEEMIDNLEVFNLVKRYPSEYRYISPMNTGEEFQLRLLRKLPLFKLNEKVADYSVEIRNYIEECIDEDKALEKDELLSILSPYLGQEDVDEATLKRIDPIFEDLKSVVDSARKASN